MWLEVGDLILLVLAGLDDEEVAVTITSRDELSLFCCGEGGDEGVPGLYLFYFFIGIGVESLYLPVLSCVGDIVLIELDLPAVHVVGLDDAFSLYVGGSVRSAILVILMEESRQAVARCEPV